ncbi:hypothetical protein K9B33_15855, partial [Sphingobium sp. 3R8]|uniref:hypothetical protein n=1 Tax=Sphingobium sp. 3R8 TaxID=2874921 RepID=UPI001CCF8DE1
LVTLKRAGVANVVIAAMVDRCTGASKSQGAVNEASDPTVKRSPGLYIDLGTDTAHKLVKIRPTNASGGTVTGNGSLLFPFRVKLAIPRASAQSVSTSSSPKFFFYFETDDAKVGEFGTSATAAAQSPTEFSLIRFKEKNSQREILIRKQTMFVGSIGIDPKETIQFSVEEIGDGAFKVSSNSPLLSGEYGFLLRAGSESYRIYDFHIP